MNKGRRSMPRLDLVSKNDFNLVGVLAVGAEQRFQDVVDGKSDLRAEWADVVH